MRPGKTELTTLAFIIWLAFSYAVSARSVSAQQLPNQHCDDLVYIRSQEQRGFLDFPGSPFKPITKVTVSLRCVKHGTMGDERLYEDLWYQGQNPLGIRRYRDFDVDPKDLLYVYLSSSSSAENAAAANALVRILLDANLNRDAITGVSVPAGSFWPLVDQMESENFYRSTKLTSRPSVYIALPLFSEEGHKVTVVWAESN